MGFTKRHEFLPSFLNPAFSKEPHPRLPRSFHCFKGVKFRYPHEPYFFPFPARAKTRGFDFFFYQLQPCGNVIHEKQTPQNVVLSELRSVEQSSVKKAARAANSSMHKVSARRSPEIPAACNASAATAPGDADPLSARLDSFWAADLIITEAAKFDKVFLMVFRRLENRLRTRG
jgi:hypothetical protein